MTNHALRSLPLLVAALAGSFTLAARPAFAASAPAQAPGRVIFPVDGGVVTNDDSGGGASAAAALPGGGAVLVGNGGAPGGAGAFAAEITANGSLNPLFGSAGVVKLPQLSVQQVVLEPDGGIVVEGVGPGPGGLRLPRVVLVRLDADGSIDTSFGANGVDTLPIETSGAGVAVGPGGDLLVAGLTGSESPGIATNPAAIPDTQWVVARLTPTGALDPSFGQGGVQTIVGQGANATGVAALGNGDIVTTGAVLGGPHTDNYLTRLLPSGAADPTFNVGQLVTLPTAAGAIIANPDGTVLVSLAGGVERFTAGGVPDPSFGTAGIASLTGFAVPALVPSLGGGAQPAGLLASAGDSAIAYTGGAEPHVERLSADGAVDPTLGGPTGDQLRLAFGGGGTGAPITIHPHAVPSLDQDGFLGSIVGLAGGSYLAFGGVSVVEGTGEGEGRSVFDFAAAGLTPSFAPDPSFGGPATALYAKLRVIRQRASTAHARHGVLVELTLSQPGLARVVIRAHGRVVAANVLPIFAPGEATLPVELTSYGNQLLRTHHGVRLSATLTGRDLLTNSATSTASGTLH